MRKRRLMRKLKPLLLALALAAALLIIRGCIAAFSSSGSTTEKEESADAIMVSLYHTADGEAITIDLDRYLVGVVAAEVPATFHPEALKAQAVAARTYALYRIEGGGCKSGYDVCTDSACCQAYVDPDSFPKDKLTTITQAVYATSNEVIRYDGELIDALFHSTSGGMTEDSENVFASAVPYLRSVVSDEIDAPKYENQAVFSCAELEVAFGTAAEELEVVSRYDSGRVALFRAGSRTYSGREVRKLLGLDSANFTLERSGDTVIFHTKGYGHGVGMSQTGANAMAQQGANYQEILTYYYTGVEISEYP